MTACFDRIVPALIFTAVAQAVTEYCLLAFGVEAGNVEAAAAWGPALSVTVAVLLGLGASCLSNTDALHGLLRRARVTRETSHPTEWYSTFARYGESCCVVPHLQGERRLYGFAEEWPGPRNAPAQANALRHRRTEQRQVVPDVVTPPVVPYRAPDVIEQAERGSLFQPPQPGRQFLDIADKCPRPAGGRNADLPKPRWETMEPLPVDLFEPSLASRPSSVS